MSKGSAKINIRNKRASYEHELLDKFIAGIVLLGTEIKSIKQGKASLAEGYCYFNGSELYLKNVHIAEYRYGNMNNHEPRRERKLLLNKSELNKIKKKHQEKGLTIIPLKIFINERSLAKVEIALAKGKKIHDKRSSLKEKELKKDIKEFKI